MTEEEKEEYNSLCVIGSDNFGNLIQFDTIKSFDFLIEHHFDFRDLIEKGLAIAVTEENNPYK